MVAWKNVIGRLRALRLCRQRCWFIAACAASALPLPPAFGRGRLRAVEQPLIGPDGARHALAEADAPLAPDVDLKNPFAGRLVFDDRHVAVLEVLGFVRAKPGVRHEQHKIMNLLGIPFVMVVERLARAGAWP